MDTEQLQQFLRDYPDGVTMVFYLKQTKVEAWYRNAQFDDTTPEFVPTTIENLPGQFDYRCMLLHFTKMPLYINKDPYYLEKYEDQTIFLQNDSNQCVQRVALTMWPERKVIIGVGCKYGQEGYLQALNMLKNDKLIREQQLKQRQVRLEVSEQVFNLDIIRAPKQLRRMSQPQIFFWFKDMKDGIDLLPELYQIISQYPSIYFSFTFSQQTKAAIESNLSEYYYLNLINIVECINQDLINLLTVNLSENESKGLYFYIPAQKPRENAGESSTQCQGSLFDKETGEKQLVSLILTLERSAEQSSFNKRTTVQEYCQFNMEHEQMLGFHGKGLKYVQQVGNTRGNNYDSYCLFEVALEDEKSVEYVRSVLALQKKYTGTYFVVSLRNQFNINAEFLNTIQQKDRSFKELNLVEGFSHTLRAELGEESERSAFVGYVYVRDQEQICSGEVYKEVDKVLSQHVQELERLKDETPAMLEADYDCLADEASIVDDGLLFRGYRLRQLSVLQPYPEGKDFCVCYLNRGSGFEKSCEVIYRLKELLSSRCYFMVIVKGVSERSQIAELSKRAFYLQRLNVYGYRRGFNRFMEACNKGEFNNQAVFYSSDGQAMPLAVEAGANSVDILQFSLSTSPQFQELLRSLVPSQQRQDELLSRKPAQLLQINKPAHNNFVHSGVVFSGQLFAEYGKQKLVLFVFLSEATKDRWPELQQKLLEFQQSKVCAQIMYTLICAQNVTQANISNQLLEKDPNFRKLNYLYDYAGNCAINSEIALCHVWDVHGCECHLFQSLEEVEKEYLEVAISEARKNTNVFTEAAYVEIQQIQYPFALRAGPKAVNQQCLFVYLGNYEMATLLPQLQFVLNLQTYFKDFYIVSGVSFQSEAQIEELRRVYFYDTEVNVVQVTGDAFTVPFQFNFSDQNGLQQQIGQAKDELLNLIQNKSKYREYAEQKAVQANRSMSVIVDGVQMPYLNKAYDCACSRFVIAQLSMDDLSSAEKLQELDAIQAKNVYLLVATTAQDFRAMNRLLKETPQAGIYNIVNDCHKFLETRGRFIYVGEQGEREEFDDFKSLNEGVLEKIGKNQTDLAPADAQTMEVVINDRRIEFSIVHKSRSRYGQQQLVLTFYEDVASAADLIYEQYVKQQTNSMQYHVAVFPTEKLLKEVGRPDSFFDLKSVLRHYNYINVAVCDQGEMLDLVGQTFANINHKYTRVQLQELGKGDMYCFASFEIPVQPQEEALKRLGVFTPYLKKADDFREDAAGFVLYPLAHEDLAIARLVELQAKYQDLQFIAQVQDFIKGEPFTQIQRYKSDTKIRLCFGSVLVEQDVLDVEAARTIAERAQPKPLTAVFDYEISKISRLEPEKMQFQLDGYAFQLIQKVTTYAEGMTIYYMNMNEADLQELLRFAELVTANGIFAFVTVTGVQDVAALEALSARLPMLKTLNVAKYISGMELVPAGRIYHFNDQLHFAGVFDVYHADAFGQNPDIQKITFDLKFGQKVPQQNEEGYNPANPNVDENGKLIFKLKGRRYRAHKNKYMNQRQIVWANDPSITPEKLQKLDGWMNAGILVIGSFPQVPVFDDEMRYQDEQIDHEAKKDLDEGMPEEDRKTIVDEKKKQLELTRLRAEHINIVDFDCGPDTVGYIFMDASARYQTKLMPFDELEKIMPVIQKPQETDENTTAAE